MFNAIHVGAQVGLAKQFCSWSLVSFSTKYFWLLAVHSTKPEGLYSTSALLVLDWAEWWVLCVAPYFFQVDAYSWMLAWLHFEYRSAFCCWCIYLLHYLTERIFVVENVSMMHSLKRLTSLKKKWMSSLEHQRPPPYLFHQQRETSHQVPD